MFAAHKSQNCEAGIRGHFHRLNSAVPLLPKTESEFLRIIADRVQKGSDVQIEIIPGIFINRATTTRTVGLVGLFDYVLVCNALINGKERVQYERLLFQRKGTSEGSHDDSERNKSDLISLISAKMLKEKFQSVHPAVHVQVGLEGGTLGAEASKFLMGEALEAGLDLRRLRKLVSNSSL